MSNSLRAKQRRSKRSKMTKSERASQLGGNKRRLQYLFNEKIREVKPNLSLEKMIAESYKNEDNRE